MKKKPVSCLLIVLLLGLSSPAWAVDVGWMQQGVRVWYFGAASTGFSSDAEEAYLFNTVNGSAVQVYKHSAINHWGTPNPVDTGTYSFLDKGPCWMHPQVLQTLQSGETWKGQVIATVLRGSYTYGTFISEVSPDGSIPYLLLPIKTLFELQAQRNLVKIVYYIDQFSTGIAYFDADTGLLLLYETSNGFVTIFFILSEINYNFAAHQAFAEDNGPHTGFKSNIIKTSTAANYVMIQSSVETRYGSTVQMWVSTSAGGSINLYAPPNENYCFFGDVPILRRKNMTVTPNYPPEGWNAYGQYLWWWVPAGALQNSAINVFDAPMTRISTNPYTFTATGVGTALYFSNIIFDNDGYLTDFSARYPAIGLIIDLGPSASAPAAVPIHLVDGLAYYKNTMGNATPVEVYHRLTLTVVSDTAGKGGGLVNGGGSIACRGHGSSPSGMSGNCQVDFLSGTTVNLTQYPDADTTWGTWSVSACSTNQSCPVVMSSDLNIIVTFPYSFMAKVNSNGYACDSIAEAYGNAGPVDIIYSRADTFAEDFILSGPKAITFLGGRDAWYLPLNDWTTLQGKLAIEAGSLTVERLVIR